MHFLRISITLLAVIAHVHCATLRQYSRDYLIPLPEPQVGSKRITTKSVFIAPAFNQSVRCAEGYREDASGRCVKLVHVNQAAQLDFLLQRLNIMYGEEPVVNHSEKQPLQVAVGIPVEPAGGGALEETSVPAKKGEMYSQSDTPHDELILDMFKQPEVLKDSSNGNSTKEHGEKVGSVLPDTDKKPSDKGSVVHVPNGHNGHSELPDSEKESQGYIKRPSFIPSKEFFHVEEEPIVTLITIMSEDEENLLQSPPGKGVKSPATNDSSEGIPDRPAIISNETGVVEAEEKETLKVIKKETQLGDSSVQLISQDVPKIEPVSLGDNSTKETSHSTKETSPKAGDDDKPVSNVHLVGNKNEQSTPDILQEESSANEGVYNMVKSDDTEEETTNEVDKTRESNTVTSSTQELSSLTSSTQYSSSLTSSSEESSTATSTNQESSSGTSLSQVSSTKISSTQHSISSTSSVQESSTKVMSTQESSSVISSAATDDDYDDTSEVDVNTSNESMEEDNFGEDGENIENLNEGTTDNVYDYTDDDVDLEVEFRPDVRPAITGSVNAEYIDKHYPEVVTDVTVAEHLLDSEDSSAEIDTSSESEVVEVHDDESVDEGELVGFDESENENATLSLTNTNVRKELKNGTVVPDRNGTKFGEISTVSQASDFGAKKRVEIPSTMGIVEFLNDSTIESESSVFRKGAIEILKINGTLHNVYSKPDRLIANAQTMAVQTQHQSDLHPTHPSVHVVYPQPVLNVNINQNTDKHPIVEASHGEPNIKPEENSGSNTHQLQFHNNYNPNQNPVHHSNENPVNQMPVIDKTPEIPPKYGTYPYPPVSSHSEIHRPNLQPHNYPNYHHHQSHQSQPNYNQNLHNGFVRFPSESIQTGPHSRPYASAHDQEVNTVRFPQENTRYNDKYSRWGGNDWRYDESRGHRPDQRHWPSREPETQYPQGTTRRNYWIDNWPNRRRAQPNYY